MMSNFDVVLAINVLIYLFVASVRWEIGWIKRISRWDMPDRFGFIAAFLILNAIFFLAVFGIRQKLGI